MSKLNFKTISTVAVEAAYGAAGVAASRYVKNGIDKATASKPLNPKVNALIRIALGAALPSMAKGKSKGGAVKGIAMGMMTEGAVDLAKSFGVPGLGGVEYGDSLGDPWDNLGGYANNEEYLQGTGDDDDNL
jgi:hypothetical protein